MGIKIEEGYTEKRGIIEITWSKGRIRRIERTRSKGRIRRIERTGSKGRIRE